MQAKTEELVALGPDVTVAAATTAHWLSKWMYHIRSNVPAINLDFQSEDANIGSLEVGDFRDGVEDPTQVLILGSGPSLHLADDIIKDWKGILVAGPTNAAWAAAHGRIPDIIFSVDANIDSATALGDFDWWQAGTILMCSPDCNPAVVNKWESNRRWFLAHMSPLDGSLQPDREMYNVLLHLMFPEITTWGFMAGCTPVQAIQQMHVWGKSHGVENIFTLGTDFAYSDKLQRHLKWEYKNRKWTQVGDGLQEERPGTQIIEVDGKKTTQQMVSYLDNYYKVILIDRVSVYDCSEGIVKWVPKADIRKVIETTGRAYAPQTPDEIKTNMQEYLQLQIDNQTARAQAASISGTSTKTARSSSIFDMLEVSTSDGKPSLSWQGEPSTPEKPSGTDEDQLELPFEPSKRPSKPAEEA
jgi:hypothetical protein